MTANDIQEKKAKHVAGVVAEMEPFMVTKEQAASLCGVGITLWEDLTANGRNPLPRRLGRRLLWLREELEQWCRAGCPIREKWEAMKKDARNA